MNFYRSIALIAATFTVFIFKGCIARNEVSDNVKILHNVQVALRNKVKAENIFAKSEASYQQAMTEFENTLEEGDHRRGLKYLFIDLNHIQRMDGVKQVFHQPVKERGPVIEPDRLWENDRVDIWSAPVWSVDKSLWQMWY